MNNILKTIYIRTTGYSYTNMGRMFIRFFVGIMLMQFGIRQLYNFHDTVPDFPSILGMSPQAGLIVLIVIELFCSLCIMIGFCTRIMTIPPMIAMLLAEWYLLTDVVTVPPYEINWAMPGYVPVMFLGIYFFILLVGPGKISVDYFLSLYLLHSNDESESELEEV